LQLINISYIKLVVASVIQNTLKLFLQVKLLITYVQVLLLYVGMAVCVR
jgi:hypothetical protein